MLDKIEIYWLLKKSSENMAKFRYFGTTVTDQNSTHEGIKSRLNSGNVCYDFVQSLLSSRLLSKNLKIKLHKISGKYIKPKFYL
jgi:hypothetical protein